MDFDYSPDQLQFKNELREFLIAEVPEDKQAVFGLATEAQYRIGGAALVGCWVSRGIRRRR